MTDWWIKRGYPAFEGGKDGFPRPGQVLKYYRVATSRDDGKPWTQGDLARVLGISEQAARDMENRDTGFSIERRRFVSGLFNIPPILLGIITLNDILNAPDQTAAEKHAHNVLVGTTNKTQRPHVDTEEYHKTLLSYWEFNHQATAQDKTHQMRKRISRLSETLVHTTRDEKSASLILLTGYHQCIANILRDQRAFKEALTHLDEAVSFAEATGDRELLALALHRRAITHQEHGNLNAALTDSLRARAHEQKLPSNLLATILLETGHIQAKLAQTETDRTTALKTIDKGGSIIRQGAFIHDPHFLKLNEERYTLTRGAALIAIGWHTEAITELAEIEVATTRKRRYAYYNILQAQAYLNKHMYPAAAALAEEAITIAKEINSVVNLQRLLDIYARLKASSYRNNPDVARLEYLFKYQ